MMIEDRHQHGPHILVITGPVGAGKSTVSLAIANELERRNSSFAMVDMDFLRQSHPHPVDDPFNSRMGFHNLAAIWPNFRQAGGGVADRSRCD